MVKVDAFGERKYGPKDIFTDKKVVFLIEIMLKRWLSDLKINSEGRESLIKHTIESCKRSTQKSDHLEDSLIEHYEEQRVLQRMFEDLNGRGEMIYTYLKPHLRNGVRILDIGTGPGIIAKALHDKHFPVTAQDIGDFRLADLKTDELPFYITKDGEILPFNDSAFDLALLVTVLHHSKNPLQVLGEAKRLSHRVAILESVYGVTPRDIPPENLRMYKPFYAAYFNLGIEQQKKYSTFLDWFLNMLSFKNKAQVPCNYNSSTGWEKVFRQHGFEIEQRRIVGVDQKSTPEIHAFYMLKS